MARSTAKVAFQIEALGVTKASKSLNRLNDRFKKIGARLEKINKKYQKQTDVLGKFKSKLSSVGITANRTGEKLTRVASRSLRRFRIGVHRTNKKLLTMQRRFRDVENRLRPMLGGFNKVGKKLRNIGLAMTLGLTLPIGAMGRASIAASADFETGMNKVKVLTKNVRFDDLRNEAKRLGAITQYTATETADAMSFLAMAGFKSNQILGSMKPTLDLAAAGNMDLARSADIVSNVMTGYGISVDKISTSVDALAGTFSESNTNLTQLGESLKDAGPIASSLNIPFNETLSIIGAFGNAGFQGERSGTALARGLARLIKPTKEVKDAFRGLGIDPRSLKDSEGNLNSLTAVLELLEKRGAKTDDYLAIFGQDAGKAFVALKKQGVASIRALEAQIANSSGRAAEIAAAITEGANGAIKKIKSALEALYIAIGDSGLLGWFTSLADLVAKFIRGLSRLNPVILKYGSIIAMVVAVTGPLLLIFSGMILLLSKMVLIWTFLTPIILSAAGALALLALKALLVVAAVAAVVYAGWFLWENWDQILTWMGEFWDNTLKDIVKNALLLFGPGGIIIRLIWEVYDNWESIVKGLIKYWNKFVDLLGDFGREKLGIEKIKIEVDRPDLPAADNLGPTIANEPVVKMGDTVQKLPKQEGLGPLLQEDQYKFSVVPELKLPDIKEPKGFVYNPFKGFTDEISDAFSNPFIEPPKIDTSKVEVPKVEPKKALDNVGKKTKEVPTVAASFAPGAPQMLPQQSININKKNQGPGIFDPLTKLFPESLGNLADSFSGFFPDTKGEKGKGFFDRMAGLLGGDENGGDLKKKRTFELTRFESFDEKRFNTVTEKKETVEIEVNFKNTPRGTKITTKNPSRLPLRINQGLAFDRELA